MQRLDIVSGVSMHHMAISSSNCAKQEADALVFWLEHRLHKSHHYVAIYEAYVDEDDPEQHDAHDRLAGHQTIDEWH